MAAPELATSAAQGAVSSHLLNGSFYQQQLLESELAPTILVIDDLEINRQLLRAILKTAPYRILEARRASEAFSVLEREKVDLVIVDMMMPGLSGPDFCQRVKTNRRTQLVPILMLTSMQGVENEIAGISSGADEFMIKPLHPAVVRARIRTMLRNKLATDSLDEAETILFALAQAVEQRDRATSDHCQRLAAYSVALGTVLGLPQSQLIALHRGGYLHDIGKVGVPDSILFKPGALTQEEWIVMRNHTLHGEQICKPMKSLAHVLPIIRSHHERWDGTGYPDGLRGEKIPLLARILQVVDIYDALTTARSYKPAFDHAKAMEILEEETARGWRDAKLVPLFRELCEQGLPSAEGVPPIPGDSSFSRSLESMRLELMK